MKFIGGTMRFPLLSVAALSFALLPGLVPAASLLPEGWNAKLTADKVLAGLVCVTAPQVKGAHDAEMVIVGDRVFVVYEANDVRAGESAAWAYVYSALSVVNLKTLKVEQIIPFAKSEQAFANETLPVGSCFVPRIIKKDERTVRCYFASEAPGKRQEQMWYTDFDLGRMAFDNRIQRVKIKTAAGTVDMQPQYLHADAAAQGFKRKAKDYGLYLFDSFKLFDGRTYVALNNFPVGQNALAVANESLDTFEVLGHYNEPQTAQLSESAVNRLPDGIWMAICRNDKGNYHFSTSADGKTWSVGREQACVPNGANSKPTFDRFNGIYYLGWQERTRIGGVSRSVFNVDVSADGQTWERKYRFETEKSFQYPTFRPHQGVIYLTVTQGDTDSSRKERIMFGKLE
ncbi:MAG: sialidase family protein [Kiritimatiellaeota bacterium]|nr:sialidase family protein [Kiritimatiellota bacterium]